MRQSLVVDLVAAPLLVVAAPGAKEKSAAPDFATGVGDTWLYEIRSPDRTSELTEAVNSVTEKGGARVVAVARTCQGETTEFARMEVSGRGVCRVWVAGRDLDDPEWLVKVPIKAGDTWDVPLAGQPALKITWAVRGEEDVEVPAGKVQGSPRGPVHGRPTILCRQLLVRVRSGTGPIGHEVREAGRPRTGSEKVHPREEVRRREVSGV